MGAEDEAGRDGKAGLGEAGEVGALATGFGELHGERIAEEENVRHKQTPENRKWKFVNRREKKQRGDTENAEGTPSGKSKARNDHVESLMEAQTSC